MSIITTVTPEQKAFFEENGFLALGPITTPEELAWLRSVYDRIFAQRAGRDEGMQFDLGGSDEEGKEAALPQILSPHKYAPELNEGEFVKNALSIGRALIGDTASGGIGHAIFKPAGIGAATPWHQDEAYWDPTLQYNSVSLWMPLQEATVENGCLWFVPGSHKWDIKTHRPIGGDVRVHGLELHEPDQDELTRLAVPCPLEPGGVTVHYNRTLHYAGPNTSGIPRRALILGASLPTQPYPGHRRFPWNEIKQTPRAERERQAAERRRTSRETPAT